MTASDLSGVSSTYYTPAAFRKTTLKGYGDYTYVDKRGDTVSIFSEFPAIAWDKQGESFFVETEKPAKK
jgi:hypothetical protein